MTNPYPFTKAHNPSQLHNEFQAAFPGKVRSIHSSGLDHVTEVAPNGNVINENGLSDAEILSVINAHVPRQTPDQRLRSSPIFNNVDWGALNAAQKLDVLRIAIRRLMKEPD